jgi:uncharacterized protein YneF (UPF0154 family)
METKKCPFCAEEIRIEAIKCKHCGEFLETETQSESNNKGVWKCKKCKEEVEDSYDICWNCGATKEGIIDKETETDFKQLKKEVEKRNTTSGDRHVSYALLGSILLIISLVLGIYGIMLATGQSAKYFSWEPPFAEYEIKTIIFIGIGIVGSIVSLIILFNSETKKRDIY